MVKTKRMILGVGLCIIAAVLTVGFATFSLYILGFIGEVGLEDENLLNTIQDVVKYLPLILAGLGILFIILSFGRDKALSED